MKFNFISINSNLWKHDSEENKFSLNWAQLTARTKYEIKLSSVVDGFFRTDKFV